MVISLITKNLSRLHHKRFLYAVYRQVNTGLTPFLLLLLAAAAAVAAAAAEDEEDDEDFEFSFGKDANQTGVS